MIIHVHTDEEEKALRLPSGPFCWVCHVAYFKDRVDALEAAIDALQKDGGPLSGLRDSHPALTELNRVRQAKPPLRVLAGPR